MSLYIEKKINESHLAIWQITESEQELFALALLNEKSKSEVRSFRSETRRKEWLTLRIVLRNVLNVAHYDDIVYDDKGKPHLKNGSGYISFSHTKNFAAVFFHPEKSVGIDVETIHPRIEKISRKFLNKDELTFVQNVKRIEMLHIIWGCKEVLFKIYGKGGLDFKNQMRVHPFTAADSGTVQAELNTDGKNFSFAINYFFSGTLIVVYGAD